MPSFPSGALKIGVAVLACAALSACTTSTHSSSERKQQTFPFVQFAPDGLLCDTTTRAIRASADRVLESNGMTALHAVNDRILFLEGNKGATAEFSKRGAVSFVSTSSSKGSGERRLRVELVPKSDSDCVAVKLWEECGPSLAPEGAPREWHWCGDPPRAFFVGLRNAVLEGLGVQAVEPD